MEPKPRTNQLMKKVRNSGALARNETGRGGNNLFYAQSWALTAMLMLSPEYGPRFPLLVSVLAAGVAGGTALSTVYRISPHSLKSPCLSR